jgi:hypothetical protein
MAAMTSDELGETLRAIAREPRSSGHASSIKRRLDRLSMMSGLAPCVLRAALVKWRRTIRAESAG